MWQILRRKSSKEWRPDRGGPKGGDGEEEEELEESGAAFGLHVVLLDMRGRVRGKSSVSINSCYITSLC